MIINTWYALHASSNLSHLQLRRHPKATYKLATSHFSKRLVSAVLLPQQEELSEV